mgnify:CR=1 FL=1
MINGRLGKFSSKQKKDIISDYIKGVKPKAICSKYDISNTTLYKLLRQNNVEINSRKRGIYGINLDELLKDFLQGHSTKVLMEKYKCSRDIIATRKYRFKKEGLLSIM